MRNLLALLVLLLTAATASVADTTAKHGLAMHGEPKHGAGFKHFDYVNPNAPKGGSVVLSATGSFDSLNPFIVRGQPAAGIGLMYDSLTTQALDEPFTQYGLLAESIKTPSDRSWVEFKLRPEARWHDGQPVTADDVVFTFETLTEKGDPQYRFYYGSVDRVEKIDEHTVRFVFKPGENRELPLIIGEMQVLPKHYWQGREFDNTTLEPPLGSGPYRIESVDPGRSITFRRVPEYWGRDLAVKVGTGNFDQIRYDYYRDRVVSLEAFKAGEYDYRAENIAKAWATAYDIPALRNGLIVKDEVEHQRTAPIQGFVFNVRRPLFEDRRVREALDYAFDFEWSNAKLFYDQYRRTRSYFDNSELSATGTPSGEELELLEQYRGRIPDEVFTQEFQPATTDGSGRIRSNLRKADELLREAGWIIKDGKRVNAETGQPFEFELLLVGPTFERIALPFAKNLERLGITMRIRTVDSAQYIKRLETFDYDMIVGIWGQSLSPGNEQRSFWSSAAADRPGSRNYIGIKDPVVDELIELLIAAPDRESLVQRTRALDRVLQWGHYVIPQWHLDLDRLAYWNKFGRPEVTPLRGTSFNTWWLDPERAAALGRRRAATGN